MKSHDMTERLAVKNGRTMDDALVQSQFRLVGSEFRMCGQRGWKCFLPFSYPDLAEGLISVTRSTAVRSRLCPSGNDRITRLFATKTGRGCQLPDAGTRQETLGVDSNCAGPLRLEQAGPDQKSIDAGATEVA